MYYSIAVTLKVVTIKMRGLGKSAAVGVFYSNRIFGHHEKSLAGLLCG